MLRNLMVTAALSGLLVSAGDGQTRPSKGINVGIHVGSRLSLPGPQGFTLSVRTTDSTLQVDTTRTGSALLAGANVTVFPFQRDEIRWFGLMLNLNLINVLDISNSRLADLGAGIGFAFRLDPRFSVGVTVNQFEQMQPRSWVVDLAGEQLLDPDGSPVTSIDQGDANLYQTKQARRFGMWFVFMF
jgi:hypothetical protein